MATIDDLINASAYGRAARAEGLAMADPLPKDDPNKRVPAPGKTGTPSSPYLPGKSPIPSKGLAHHREHFVQPRNEKDLIQKLMKDETLEESDFRRILGPDYKQKIQQYQQSQSMLISENASDMEGVTRYGFFLDSNGGAFINTPDGLLYDGDYDPDRHGLRVPLAQSPQDGRAPSRLFFNNPYPGSKPDLFIKTKDRLDESKKMFKLNTGIDLAKKNKMTIA